AATGRHAAAGHPSLARRLALGAGAGGGHARRPALDTCVENIIFVDIEISRQCLGGAKTLRQAQVTVRRGGAGGGATARTRRRAVAGGDGGATASS
ncbi:unnamed protein product, partial [Urochloa humidicola]